MRYYLAYGSNLNKGQMQMRCPGAKPVGTGYLEGYELLFKGSKTGAFLTVERKRDSKVPIGVWEISPTDEAQLDIYEGYPRFYYKKEIDIKLKGKRKVEKAFIYIMDEDRYVEIPSDMYVNTCKKGYKDFGFNSKYLEEALQRSYREVMNDDEDKYKTMPPISFDMMVRALIKAGLTEEEALENAHSIIEEEERIPVMKVSPM